MSEHKAASVEINVFDAEGLPVEPPVVLDLETTYIFQAMVRNLTRTAGGQLWEALLEMGIGITIDGIDLVPYATPTSKFAPGQSQNFIPQIYVKSEYAGMVGRITVKVADPFGKVLVSAQERFRIGSEISPYAAYQPLVSTVRGGIDMPFLNPDLDNQERVVMGGVAERQPPAPKPPPKKIDYSKREPPPGLDSSSTPEPEVEFEGETVFGGRLG